MATYEAIRDAVLSFIRKMRQTDEKNLTISEAVRHVQSQLSDSDPTDVERYVLEIIHDLYLCRIIVPGRKRPPNVYNMGADEQYRWPYFRLTDHGEKVIAQEDYTPYDPSGYLARFCSAIPGVDQDVVMYLEESLKCYGAGFLFASAVMLGCAAEKAMLQLIETFGQQIQSDTNKKKKYDKDTEHWMINQKYQKFMKCFRSGIPSLPPKLRQNIDVRLDQTFDLIRTTRNRAGHPTGSPIERGVVYGQLQIFPHYCKLVYNLMGHFRKNPM